MEDIQRYFIKFLAGGIICLALSIYLVNTAHKGNTSIQKVNGTASVSSSYLKIADNKKTFTLLGNREIAAQVKMSWYLLGFSVFTIAIVVAGKLNGKLI
jgi:hypothetical protein